MPPSILSRLGKPGAGSTVCRDENCGGPAFCVHRYLDPIDARAVLAWRVYDVPKPLPAGVPVSSAAACVDALLRAKAGPADLLRCGADPERLAVLGYGPGHLLGHMTFEDMCQGFGLTWDRLVAFGWHPDMLADRTACPVISLVEPPVLCTAERLLGSFELGYDRLHDDFGLTAEELCALGFTAPLLTQLGMRREHVAQALCRPDIVGRQGGAAWYCRALALTPAVLAGMPSTPGFIAAAEPAMKAAYAGLTIHLAHVGAAE